MQRFSSRSPSHSDTLAFWFTAIFLSILWVAGGSARYDAAGQIVVRLAAWTLLGSFVIFGQGVRWRNAIPVHALLAASGVLVLAQLVPLPPGVWSVLPSRDVLVQSATVAGLPQPWRPLSISPSATINALGSLVVPAAILVLVASLHRTQNNRLVPLVLGLVCAGCILGLLQLSGSRFDNPLINEIQGFVSGNFANRNHFALFVAIGIVLACVWGARETARSRWKLPLALLLLPFLMLMVVATGSRSGLILGAIATVAGLMIARREVAELARGLSARWIAGLAAILGAIILAVGFLTIEFGRAEAIDRLTLDASQDLRVRAFPVIARTVWDYFPAGSGFGTFDAVYRIVEPDDLLRTLYFNHAHNDWLEIALNGGLAGGLLAVAAVAWWLIASVRVWRSRRGDLHLAQCGSVICLLTMVASLTDYPARTPMILAVLMLGAIWLSNGSFGERGGPSRKGTTEAP